MEIGIIYHYWTVLQWFDCLRRFTSDYKATCLHRGGWSTDLEQETSRSETCQYLEDVLMCQAMSCPPLISNWICSHYRKHHSETTTPLFFACLKNHPTALKPGILHHANESSLSPWGKEMKSLLLFSMLPLAWKIKHSSPKYLTWYSTVLAIIA